MVIIMLGSRMEKMEIICDTVSLSSVLLMVAVVFTSILIWQAQCHSQPSGCWAGGSDDCCALWNNCTASADVFLEGLFWVGFTWGTKSNIRETDISESCARALLYGLTFPIKLLSHFVPLLQRKWQDLSAEFSNEFYKLVLSFAYF